MNNSHFKNWKLSQRDFFSKKFDFNNSQIKIENNKIAKQSDQSFVVEWNETTMLVTVCISEKPTTGNFLPLTINFQENLYAAGKIPGSFFRREGKPSDYSVLSARIIDRSIRNRFPKNFRNEIQIIVQPLSVDYSVDVRVVSLFAASLVLNASPLPFNVPIAGITVGYVNGEFICNPNSNQMQESELEMFLAGNQDEISMIEVGANQLPEEKIMEAIRFGHNCIQKLITIQEKVLASTKLPEGTYPLSEKDEELKTKIHEKYKGQIDEIVENSTNDSRKSKTSELITLIAEDFAKTAAEEETMSAPNEDAVREELEQIFKERVRAYTLENKKRIDKRKFDEIRDISCEIDYLPIVHGSAIFNRGGTQTLSIVTLGPTSDKQIIDNITKQDYSSFMHHYKSLPFSIGEAARLRGVSRREVGHGFLGEKALKYIIPDVEDFPYTTRIMSEVMSSDGSTSQAAICSAVLSLKAAGVPIKETLAGIAIGLIKDGKNYHILSDIQAWEDFYCDMDFKVAGSKNGVCAIQMDLKISGLPVELIVKILERARQERLKILDIMNAVIEKPRSSLSEHAIKFEKIQIDSDDIGTVVGPGGKNIKNIVAETENTSIDISDDGTVLLYNKNQEMIEKAKNMIHTPQNLPEVGQEVEGTIVKIMEYGAFVKIDGVNSNGLIHISKLSDGYVKDINSVVALDDRVRAEVITINEKKQISLKLIEKI